MRLEAKVCIITGAASGVAKGVAVAFAKAGAKLLIADRNEAQGRETEAELKALNTQVRFVPIDLACHDQLGQIIDAAIEAFGRLDVLVNAAQASRMMPIAELTPEAARLSFDTGFWPTLLLMQHAYPHLKATRGSVINFGSGVGFTTPPTQGSYAAAKEAIRAISKTAALEWGEHGIRVNIVCPFANSPGVQDWAKHAPESYAENISRVPLRRIGDCEADIGAAAVFLASDDASYITGHTLMVDGGLTRPA